MHWKWIIQSGKVRENKSTGVQKLNFELLYADCVQQFKMFPACFAHRLFLCPLLKFIFPLLFLVWLQAIENWQWYFAWTN